MRDNFCIITEPLVIITFNGEIIVGQDKTTSKN